MLPQNWWGPGGVAAEPPSTYQPTYKPGFVWPAANRRRDGHSSGTPVARRIKQPTRMTGPDRPGASAPTSFLFGLAPGGVCRAVSVAGNAVRSYRTVSPLPRPNATRRGGLFSVALSLGFDPRLRGDRPPPDVIRHRLSMEPGLSSPATFRHWPGAAVRPTDGIGMGIPGPDVKCCASTGLRKLHNRLSWAVCQPNGAGRVSISARNVSSVEGSAMPSTRAWRKWRWKAVTTARVASS